MASQHNFEIGDMNRAVPAPDAGPFTQFAVRLWRGKLWMIAGAVLGILAASLYLSRATFLYTASMKVTAAPSSQGSGSRSSALSGIASLAGVGLGSSTSGASPFEIYLETLTSEDVARYIATDPAIMKAIFVRDWDPALNAWREPTPGIVGGTARSIKKALGIPVKPWNKPGAKELAAYLKEHMNIQRDIKSPVVDVALLAPKPQLAVDLMVAVNREADRMIREQVLVRSRSYADYLEDRLPTVTVAEHREALVQALSEQEKSIMMASSPVSFAAAIVSSPVVSPLPTKPNAVTVALAFLALGFALGGGIAAIDWRVVRSSLRAARTPVKEVDAN